ncbi:MAG: sulfatase-like hydrolase/transferase, partial [Verrucomicrobiota bacterium]
DKHEEKPFFLCASFTHPHDPYIITKEWWDLYDHDEVELPSAAAENFETMHPYNQWLQTHHMIDVYPPREEDVKNARHAYYSMVSYFDHLVGELVSELERLGLSENTLILVTSDHGEMLGEHGMWFKRTYFDGSARIPLIAAGSGVAEGKKTDHTFSLVDLLPTFCDLAKTDCVEPTPGASLRELLSGNDSDDHDFAICEYLSEGVCEPMRMLVNDRGRWKYVYVHNHEEQLFDLKKDPLEQNNIAHAPENSERVQNMRQQLLDDWDPATIKEQVMNSQQRRRFVHAANAEAPDLSWDIQPTIDARQQYVRANNAQLTNVERRLPKIEPFT